MADDFKFPDEAEKIAPQQAADETDIEIEIVDDTPEADRGRKPLDKEPAEATDEELASYSDSVKKRINELSHSRHDERRAKEAVIREREELERVSRALLEENRKLKQHVSTGEQAFAGTYKSAAEAEYQMARTKFKEAHEAFDADAILDAQSALMQAQLKLERANNFKPTPVQESADVVQTAQQQPQPVVPDEKTNRWQSRNTWFGQDDEMTAVALAVHKKLVNSGEDPRSDEYYKKIDTHMRKRFPENFEEPAEVRRPATIVAPATRSTAVTKVRLTPTQVALAKRFNLSLQEYAKHAELVNGANNG